MTTLSTTHDDFSFEPAQSRVQDGTDDAGTAYQGRHVRLNVTCADASDEGAPASGSHPRRRGFGILSRLARVESDAPAELDSAPTGTHRALVDA
jgi:hypothetical protein